VLLSPIATAEAFRAGLVHRLGPYEVRIQWYSSLIAGTAVDYILASRRQESLDGFAGRALAIVLIDAMIKTAMLILYEHGEATAA
jgi:hypothetical protein